jgi:hypothetical protein
MYTESSSSYLFGLEGLKDVGRPVLLHGCFFEYSSSELAVVEFGIKAVLRQ